MAAMPFTSELVARRAADRSAVERLVSGTGSRLDAASTDLYARLVRNPGHVAGSLGMMANWDVRTLWLDLPRLAPWLALVVAENDRAVPASQGRQLLARMTSPAQASLVNLPGLGHLAHEEDPVSSAAACVDAARNAGVL
jgi:magnesium chelatase accessory protein